MRFSHPGRPLWLAVALFLLPISAAQAQVEQDRDEATVESFGLDAEEDRTNIAEEAATGPQTNALILEEEIPIEEIERTETALTRLRGLVDDTPHSDVSRAEYMFRLAELYYNRARFYEQRAYRRRDQAFELREVNPSRAGAYEENAQADLEQSDLFANQAITLYADIYADYYDTYDGIDAVLYYLGANMLQLGQNDAARMVFEDLALNHPESPYLPQALLMLGELLFVDGDMLQARTYYDAVTQFEDSSGYPYALYKLAWCEFNLAEGPEDYELAVQLLFDAIVVTEMDDAPSRVRLRRDALRDMTLFYSEVYPADLALDFFTEIAAEDAFDLVSRLARIYGDRAMYEDSNTLYRTLIGLNSTQFEIVDYQREIVRNTRPLANDVEIVRETRRLVELFQLAREFPGTEPEQIRRTGSSIELLLRQLATTYHSEGQTTQNEQLYALAYALYEDYVTAFPDSPNSYVMWFYFAELLYRNEEWLGAAAAYERSIALSTPEANQFDQEATHAACLAYANTIDLNAAASVEVGALDANPDDLTATPDPIPIPDEYIRMMDACDQYLGTRPNPEMAAEIEAVIAIMYYDHYHLDEAINRFAVISTERISVDVIRAREAAELLLDSLNQRRDYEAMKEWIDRYRGMPAINSGEFAIQLQTLSEQIDFIQCNGLYADEEFEEAGVCYIAFVESHFDSSLRCQSFYNAGLAFDRGDKLDFSISAMSYLQQYCPDDPLAGEVTYQLGRTYHRMAMFDEAAANYEEYYQLNSEAENVRDALINASRFRQGLGQSELAVRDIGWLIDILDSRDDEDAAAVAEARYQIGLVELDEGNDRDAVDAFERVAERHFNENPSRGIEAYVQIADIHAARGDADRAIDWYETAVEEYDDLDDEVRAGLSEHARDAASKAQFMLAEEIFREFEAIPLEGSEEEVQAAILEKIALGSEANTAYTLVVERYARPSYSIAAFTRVGQLYHVFYEQIIDSPIPEGLTPIQEEVYQEQIEIQAQEQKATAMTRYADAILVARETGWFNEYSELAAELYQELDPTFKAGNEIRIAPGSDTATSAQLSGFGLPEGIDRDEVAPPPPPPAPEPSPAPAPMPEPQPEPQPAPSVDTTTPSAPDSASVDL